MDYQRIYSEFINDRRLKESELKESGAYFERHHVIPRSLGGDDSDGNLLALTPEDHFFAHILLAKIHGGKMMRALFAMSNFNKGCPNRPNFRKRMQYGYLRRLVAREYAEKYSGLNSPILDRNLYTFKNHDGRVATGIRLDLMEITGLNQSQVSALILGSNKNLFGWYYPVMNNGKTSAQLFREYSKVVCRKIHHLFHFDGAEWVGTKVEFADKFGRQLRFQSKNGHCGGWYREKSDADNHYENLKNKCKRNSEVRGDISGLDNPRADKTVYDWINFVTGERKSCTRYELSVFLGIKPGKLFCLFTRKQKSVRNWGLYEVYLVKDKIKVHVKNRHGDDKSRAGL